MTAQAGEVERVHKHEVLLKCRAKSRKCKFSVCRKVLHQRPRFFYMLARVDRCSHMFLLKSDSSLKIEFFRREFLENTLGHALCAKGKTSNLWEGNEEIMKATAFFFIDWLY